VYFSDQRTDLNTPLYSCGVRSGLVSKPCLRRRLGWWRLTDSNRSPPACKAGALPDELNPPSWTAVTAAPLPLSDLVGLVGLEPTTPALSTRCSNQLSYRPARQRAFFVREPAGLCSRRYTINTCGHGQLPHRRPSPQRSGLQRPSCSAFPAPRCLCSRKEVIQPHLPVRLPCYDFTPVTNPTVVSAPLAVKLPASGETRSHGVTGGVYKTRERIHRGMLIRDY
jgi:hypothetical protein